MHADTRPPGSSPLGDLHTETSIVVSAEAVISAKAFPDQKSIKDVEKLAAQHKVYVTWLGEYNTIKHHSQQLNDRAASLTRRLQNVKDNRATLKQSLTQNSSHQTDLLQRRRIVLKELAIHATTKQSLLRQIQASNNGVTSNIEDEKNVLSETLNDIVLD